MILLTKNLVRAAEEMAAAHAAEADRYRDPKAWKQRLHHQARAASAASFANDIAVIEADIRKGNKP